MFTPGYPPIRIQAAVGEDAAVIIVDDAEARVSPCGSDASVVTANRQRAIGLPFVPTTTNQQIIKGRTVAILSEQREQVDSRRLE
jgi:hypothetical protein